MKKLMPREGKELAKGHASSNERGQDVKPSRLILTLNLCTLYSASIAITKMCHSNILIFMIVPRTVFSLFLTFSFSSFSLLFIHSFMCPHVKHCDWL